MTIQENTICGLIQSFPVLLILAQNHNRCLKTPFIYKPPSPTPSPEYYEALDALFHNLFGHGYHEYDHGHHGCQYGHGTYAYGKKWQHDHDYGHGSPCHTYGYPATSYGYQHHGHGYQGFGNHGYPSYEHPSYGYPSYGYKKDNVYNISGSNHGYKGTYAPNQVYSINHKYKIVTKRNKGRGHKRRSQKLQGFYPNQREERRYENQFGFVQDLVMNPKRIRDKLTGILHLRPETPNNNPSYIYPFNNRPGISNNGPYYDQYGRPTYQQYPYQNNQDNYEPNSNYPGDQYNFGRPVQFPTNPNQAAENQEPPNQYNPDYSIQDYSNQDTENVYQPVVVEEKSTEKAIDTPNTVIYPSIDGQNFKGNEPAIGDRYAESGTPKTSETIIFPGQIGDGQNDDKHVYGDENTEGVQILPSFPLEMTQLPSSTPIPEKPNNNLPGWSTVLPEEPNNNFPQLKPVPEATKNNLPQLNPVPEEPKNNFAQWTPVPEEPKNNLPQLIPAPEEPKNNIPQLPPVPEKAKTELPPLTPAPEEPKTNLPPLTPVPESESRNNFNQGFFKETCETIDGEVGSCVTVFDCEPYLILLKQSQSNPGAVQILRKAHCGFDGNNPKVCCPRPSFPTAPPIPSTTTTTTAAPVPDVPSGKTAESEDYVGAFPEPPVCGFSNASLSRVVGGVDANLGDFPWMALLGYERRKNPAIQWLCGGSLISSKHILTAAHCINGHESELKVVRLGELDLAKDDEGATPTDVGIKSMIKHEAYSPNAYTNDIGVLVLERDVQFTNLLKPICIPRSSELRARSFENYNPLIAGWGDTEFRGPSATHLQVLQLPVVSNDFCAKAYSPYKAQTIDERVLCAGYKKGGKDACQGDSGGPLMQPVWNNQDFSTYFYQIGVTSYGKKCAEPGFPGVYSRVTHFVPWIEEQVIGTA